MEQEFMDRIAGFDDPPESRTRKLGASQIAQRTTWSTVPDKDVTTAAMHSIHVRPYGASTETVVNAMDPTTTDDDPAVRGGFLQPPDQPAPVLPAGRRP